MDKLFTGNFDGDIIGILEDTLEKGTQKKKDITPFGQPIYLGGISERIFARISGSGEIVELDKDTLLTINSNDNTGKPGGTHDTLFTLHSGGISIIDKDTLESVSVLKTFSSWEYLDIGGTATQLFLSKNTKEIYEIDPLTGIQLNYINLAPILQDSTTINGLGGTSDRLFISQRFSVHELDPQTLLVMNLGEAIENNNNKSFYGLGGTKWLMIPLGLTTTSFAESIECEWFPVENVETYTLKYKEKSGTTWTVVENLTENNYIIENLSQNTEYDISVSAIKWRQI